MQELKKELEESNIKDKNEALKKINELNELNNKYIKEKLIIEQELNEKRQELSKKKKELSNNTREINDLKNQIKLLKEELDDLKKLINQKLKNMIDQEMELKN